AGVRRRALACRVRSGTVEHSSRRDAPTGAPAAGAPGSAAFLFELFSARRGAKPGWALKILWQRRRVSESEPLKAAMGAAHERHREPPKGGAPVPVPDARGSLAGW